jgi:hypothetical protein
MRTLERSVCAAKSKRHHAAHWRVMAFVRARVGRDAQASGSAQPRKCRA